MVTTFGHLHDERDGKCDVTCDTRAGEKAPTAPYLYDMPVALNRQKTAMQSALENARQQFMGRLQTRLANTPAAGPVIEDQHAILSLAKTGYLDEDFPRRYLLATGECLSDTGDLISTVRQAALGIRQQIFFGIQLDQMGTLKHYMSAEGWRILGERIREMGFLPKDLKLDPNAPLSTNQIKNAIQGPHGIEVPFYLNEFRGEIIDLVLPYIDASPFSIPDIEVHPEIVLRSLMLHLAESMDWKKPDEVNLDGTVPFHPERNVFGLRREPKGKESMVTACLGVIMGLLARIAKQHKDVRLITHMERDSHRLRVDESVILAAFNAYLKKIVVEGEATEYSINADPPVMTDRTDGSSTELAIEKAMQILEIMHPRNNQARTDERLITIQELLQLPGLIGQENFEIFLRHVINSAGTPNKERFGS